MLSLNKTTLFLTLMFAQDAVQADGALSYVSKALAVKPDHNGYVNLVKGLFRSKIVSIYLPEIFCEEIRTLEGNADKAEEFVKQLQQGQVPSIIPNLPDKAVQQFKDAIKITLSLPDQLKSEAEAAATNAVTIFNHIEDGIALSDLTSGWADLTSEAGCFFTDCSEPTTTVSCRSSVAATTTSDGFVAATQHAAQRTHQSPPHPASAAAPATVQNEVQRKSQSPLYPTNATAPTTTRGAAAAATQNEAQSTTQSPPYSSSATGLASTQSSWARLGILMTIAVGITNACALHLV